MAERTKHRMAAVKCETWVSDRQLFLHHHFCHDIRIRSLLSTGRRWNSERLHPYYLAPGRGPVPPCGI